MRRSGKINFLEALMVIEVPMVTIKPHLEHLGANSGGLGVKRNYRGARPYTPQCGDISCRLRSRLVSRFLSHCASKASCGLVLTTFGVMVVLRT